MTMTPEELEDARKVAEACWKRETEHFTPLVETRIKELEAALEPFAKYAKVLLEKDIILTWPIKMEDFSKAAEVLGKDK